ncbi:thiol:disulfide interchange protein TlpA [Azorhizobium doebereinerae]|uniref:thiol:disulfide interchange protein TlpA n=1 Tax=Azorhizobium doebereinerae TaxID=281091 RepID=UPI0003FF187E|nr:TlpA disulfide reductase family protein [Azorhizobium doebereinerae]
MTDLNPRPDSDPAAAPAPAEARPARRGPWRMIGLVAGATVAGAMVGALALYGMKGLPGNASATKPQADGTIPAATAALADPDCQGAVDAAKRLAPLAKGELAALSLATTPRRLPPLAFADAAGKPVTLADFKGKTLLVNLWATWCVPCRKEMPALDALEKAQGGKDFQVVAINLDTRDPKKPHAFLSEIGVASLGFYADPDTKTFQALRSVGRGFGLPTTLLVDAKGCEIGYLAGPAEWASPDAQALIRQATGKGI